MVRWPFRKEGLRPGACRFAEQELTKVQYGSRGSSKPVLYGVLSGEISQRKVER